MVGDPAEAVERESRGLWGKTGQRSLERSACLALLVRKPARRSGSGTTRKRRANLAMAVDGARPEVVAPDRQTDAIDRAPRGRELSVREDLTRIIVDWSGSWQAARPGNWLGRSPATKAALGC
jgi:hypothetical protein